MKPCPECESNSISVNNSHAFYIDIGKLPKTKAEEYIKSLIVEYFKKKLYL